MTEIEKRLQAESLFEKSAEMLMDDCERYIHFCKERAIRDFINGAPGKTMRDILSVQKDEVVGWEMYICITRDPDVYQGFYNELCTAQIFFAVNEKDELNKAYAEEMKTSGRFKDVSIRPIIRSWDSCNPEIRRTLIDKYDESILNRVKCSAS